MPKPDQKTRVPLIMRVPLGVREQPAWLFIGFMVSLVGFGQATALLESSIRQAVSEGGARAWGCILLVAGLLLMYATVTSRAALERFALRVLTMSIVAYAGWLLVAVPWNRAATAVILIGCLAVVCEVRVWHLKQILRRVRVIEHELRPRD